MIPQAIYIDKFGMIHYLVICLLKRLKISVGILQETFQVKKIVMKRLSLPMRLLKKKAALY